MTPLAVIGSRALGREAGIGVGGVVGHRAAVSSGDGGVGRREGEGGGGRGGRVAPVGARVAGQVSRGRAGGLADRSRRPRGSPNQASAEVEARVCELRRAHPRWVRSGSHRFQQTVGDDEAEALASGVIDIAVLRHVGHFTRWPAVAGHSCRRRSVSGACLSTRSRGWSRSRCASAPSGRVHRRRDRSAGVRSRTSVAGIEFPPRTPYSRRAARESAARRPRSRRPSPSRPSRARASAERRARGGRCSASRSPP